MHALTYFIAYMQTKMVDIAQSQLSRVQLEVQKNLKSPKNVENLNHSRLKVMLALNETGAASIIT